MTLSLSAQPLLSRLASATSCVNWVRSAGAEVEDVVIHAQADISTKGCGPSCQRSTVDFAYGLWFRPTCWQRWVLQVFACIRQQTSFALKWLQTCPSRSALKPHNPASAATSAATPTAYVAVPEAIVPLTCFIAGRAVSQFPLSTPTGTAMDGCRPPIIRAHDYQVWALHNHTHACLQWESGRASGPWDSRRA